MRLTIFLLFSICLIPGCHDDVEELTHLHGLDEAAVIAVLGTPTSDDTITLKHGETLPELYVEIHNTYKPGDPTITGVKIRDLRWDRQGYTEGVFLHEVGGKWVVLETCRWKDGVVF